MFKRQYYSVTYLENEVIKTLFVLKTKQSNFHVDGQPLSTVPYPTLPVI